FVCSDPGSHQHYSPLPLHDALPISDSVQTCPYDHDVATEFRFGVGVTRGTSRAALEESARRAEDLGFDVLHVPDHLGGPAPFPIDRKSTRLNSSHVKISYAVFCLKK